MDTRVQVHIPLRMLSKRLDEVLDVGLNPEVYISGDDLDSLDREDLKRVGFELEKQGLRCTVHGPYMDMSPGGADERVRELTVERYAALLREVRPFSPAVVVFHAGYEERKFDGDVDLWLEQSLKTWEVIAREAEAAGTVIALENIFEKNPEPIKRLLKRIDSPRIRSCVDVGHINIFSEAGMDEWISELAPYLSEVHIHDNHGSVDEHLPVDDGEINFSLFFSLLKRHCPDSPVYTIEPHDEEVLWRGLRSVLGYL